MTELFNQAREIWLAGGWAMILLAINALLMFGIGMHAYLYLQGKGLTKVGDKTWRGWIKNPGERRGAIGEIIEFALAAPDTSDVAARFTELHQTEIAPVARDLRFMKRSVSASPLLGLLGTVTGMLSTFQALATGSGGDQTMNMVAGGISEALITTETGLIIAIPGLFFQYILSRKRDRYEAFLARLETVCTQHIYHLTRGRQKAEAGGTES